MTTALLLSGGMDSIAVLHWCKPDLAIVVDYGQRPAEGEIEASKVVCEITRTPLKTINTACGIIGLGLMSEGTQSGIVPYAERPEWWPFRNQLIITIAAAAAVPLGVNRLLIGTVKEDRCHGDGTSEFISAMNILLSLQEGTVSLEAPALHLTASELIRESKVPRSLLTWAHSCHVYSYSCGRCRGCIKQQQVLAAIGPD